MTKANLRSLFLFLSQSPLSLFDYPAKDKALGDPERGRWELRMGEVNQWRV